MVKQSSVIDGLKETVKASLSPPNYGKDYLSLLRKKKTKEKLLSFVSDNAVKVLMHLARTTDDEEIAKKLRCKVSEVRSTLNKLHEIGLVNYIRSRNPTTGWYSYRWIVNLERFKEWLEEDNKRWKELINDEKEYYACPKCGLDAVFEFSKAFELNFRCPFCNEKLDLVDEAFLKKRK
jgi:transcription factor E